MKSIALQSSLTRLWSKKAHNVGTLLLPMLLFVSQAWAVGTPTGTSIPNSANASYVQDSGRPSGTVASNEVNTNIVTTCSLVVTPDGTVASPAISNSVAPGERTTFDFEITNTGNGLNDIVVAAIVDAASTATPDLIVIRYDSDGDGDVDTVSTSGIIEDVVNDQPLAVQVEIAMPATATTGQSIYMNLSAACQGDPSTTDDNNIVVAVVGDTPADLSLRKAVALTQDVDGSGSITVGDTVTFTLTLTNDGPNAATNVVVTDQLPTGYTYISDNGAGAYDASTGEWQVASIGLETITLDIVATVNTSGNYVNTAEVTASDQSDPDSVPNDGPDADSNGDGDPDDDGAVLPNPLNGVADLEVTKRFVLVNDADANGISSAGDTLRFTIDITNNGPDDASDIAVQDTLADGYQYVVGSISGGSSNNDAGVPTLTWTIDDLAVGADASLTADVIILATGEYSNTAEITSSMPFDPDPTNNTNTVTPPVEAVADLSLTKAVALTTDSDSSSSITVGDTVTFTLTLSNAGPNTATNVTVKDQLPDGYTYVSHNGVGSYNASTGDWDVASVVAGNSVQLNIVATVNPSGNYVNVAEVTASDQPDPDSTPNDGPDTDSDGDGTPDDDGATLPDPLGQVADLSLVKTSSLLVDTDTSGTLSVGDTLRFTLTLRNDGPNDATDIIVSDILPSGYQYVAGSIAGGDSRDDSSAPSLNWTVDSLAVSAEAVLSVDVVVLATGNYTNSATITGSTPFDNDPTNNTDTDTPNVAGVADLSLDKTVALTTDSDSSTSITSGDTVTFTLSVTNDGPNTATNVVVLDQLPSGYTYVSHNGTGGYDNATGEWEIPSISVGTTINLNIVVTVNDSGDYRNIAEITASDQFDPDSVPGDGIDADSNGDGRPDDDGASVDVSVGEVADLSLNKSVSIAPAGDVDNSGNITPGDTVIFVLRLSNTGPSVATNVVVRDDLPTGYTYVSDNGLGAYDSATGNWTLPSVPVGETSLEITATVNATGDYINVAEVTESDQFDPDSVPGDGVGSDSNGDGLPDDDGDSVDPGIGESADVSIQKTHASVLDADGSGDITPGDILRFTLTIANAGPNTARNIEVEDVLPSGYEYVASSIDGGSTQDDSAAPTLRWTISGISAGNSLTLTADVRVLSSGSYRNVATITGSTPFDPTPGNNTDDNEPIVNVTTGVANPTKLADPATGTALSAGDTLRYTISFMTNDTEVNDVVVSDTFSEYLENLTVVSTSPTATSAAINGRELDVRYSTVPANTIVRIVVEGTVADTFDVTNPDIVNPGATITFTNPDGTPGNAGTGSTSHPVTTTGGITPPRKVVDPTNGVSVEPGDVVTYTVTFSSRDVALQNVVITDTLSENLESLTIVSVTPAATSQSITGRELQVTYATLPSNTDVTVVVSGVVATVPAGGDPVVQNPGVTVTADGSTPQTSNPTTNPINQADLFVEKTSSVDSTNTVLPGGEVVYTIVVGNNGPSDARGISIRDDLPDSLEDVTWTCVPNPSDSVRSDCDTAGNGNTASGTGDINIVESARVGAGESLVFTVTSRVRADLPDGTTVENVATVTLPDNLTDPNPDNNTSTNTNTVGGVCALEIKPDGSVAAPAYQQSVPFANATAFKYTITNLSNSQHTYDLEALYLDTPSSFPVTTQIFRDRDNSNGPFDPSTDTELIREITLGVVTDGTGAVQGGESAMVWVVATAPEEDPAINFGSKAYVNLSGFCDDNNDDSVDDGTAADIDNVSEITIVNVSLNITKTAKPEGGTLNAGESLPYEMVVVNNGRFPVKETIVYDPLPRGLTYITGTQQVTLYPGDNRERICTECTFEVLQLADLDNAQRREIFEPIAARRLEDQGITEESNPTDYAQLLDIEFNEVVSEAGGQVLKWAGFPVLEPGNPAPRGDSARIVFDTNVASEQIFEGNTILNPTSARALSNNNSAAASVAVSAAAAVVPVDPDILQVGSVLLGTAFLDVDDNDIYTEVDIPVENLRIYLPDGRSTVTDQLGRYTFQDLDAGVTSIKVDPITIPGYRLKPTINEIAPGFWRERLYSGLIVRQDIPFEPPRALVAVDETLTAMRGDVMIVKELYVQDNGVLVRLNISSMSALKGLTILDQMPANARMLSEPVYAGGARGIGAEVAGEGLNIELGDVPAEFNVVVDYLLISTQQGREKVALTAPIIEWELR